MQGPEVRGILFLVPLDQSESLIPYQIYLKNLKRKNIILIFLFPNEDKDGLF